MESTIKAYERLTKDLQPRRVLLDDDILLKPITRNHTSPGSVSTRTDDGEGSSGGATTVSPDSREVRRQMRAKNRESIFTSTSPVAQLVPPKLLRVIKAKMDPSATCEVKVKEFKSLWDALEFSTMVERLENLLLGNVSIWHQLIGCDLSLGLGGKPQTSSWAETYTRHPSQKLFAEFRDRAQSFEPIGPMILIHSGFNFAPEIISSEDPELATPVTETVVESDPIMIPSAEILLRSVMSSTPPPEPMAGKLMPPTASILNNQRITPPQRSLAAAYLGNRARTKHFFTQAPPSHHNHLRTRRSPSITRVRR